MVVNGDEGVNEVDDASGRMAESLRITFHEPAFESCTVGEPERRGPGPLGA